MESTHAEERSHICHTHSLVRHHGCYALFRNLNRIECRHTHTWAWLEHTPSFEGVN